MYVLRIDVSPNSYGYWLGKAHKATYKSIYSWSDWHNTLSAIFKAPQKRISSAAKPRPECFVDIFVDSLEELRTTEAALREKYPHLFI